MTQIIVANKKVKLNKWEKYGKKRIYINATPADGSRAVGKSYDWGYIDSEGHQGGFSNYRYARQMDLEGFETMIKTAQDML